MSVCIYLLECSRVEHTLVLYGRDLFICFSEYARLTHVHVLGLGLPLIPSLSLPIYIYIHIYIYTLHLYA